MLLFGSYYIYFSIEEII